MTDWSKEPHKKWLCTSCGDVMVYDELCQDTDTGAILCHICWDEWLHVKGPIQVDPSLCDGCGAGMAPLEKLTTGTWTSATEQYCAGCNAELEPGKVAGAVDSLRAILDD